jgi:hypothetical protein
MVKATESIKKRSRVQPVVVFGFDTESEETLRKHKFLVPIRVVNTTKDVEDARLVCRKSSKGILFLNQEFRVGVDINFAEDDYVVILSDEHLEGEEVLQMLGRGSRAGNKYFSDIYYVGNPIDRQLIFRGLN